jgi:hypothetical protein
VQLLFADIELATLLRDELLITIELLDDELLTTGAEELERLVATELELDVELALETGSLSFGLSPTK